MPVSIRGIRALVIIAFCALLVFESTAAAAEPPPKKGARPPAGQIRPTGKKKARRPAAKKPSAGAEAEQSEDTASSQPTTEDGGETIAIVLSRLARTRRSELSDRDIALKAGLEFVRAVGRADGQKAAGLLEVTGYQTIRIDDEVADEPGPRVAPQTLAADVSARRPATFETLPADCVELLAAKSARSAFPAVADWMLPTDWALILKPAPGRPDWVHREACLVIRVRGSRPTIQGGTALELLAGTALPEPTEPKP
jgi:hypothetical protein